MNTAEAAAALGKTPWWIRRQCVSGELQASYYGGSWNITEDAIAAYLAAHSNAAPSVAPRRRRRRSA